MYISIYKYYLITIIGGMKAHKIQAVKHPEKLTSYWTNNILLGVTIILSGILCNIGQLATPYFEGFLIDKIDEKVPFSTLENFVFIYLAVIILVQIIRAIKRYTVRKFAFDTLTSMRLNLYNNLLNKTDRELSQLNIGSTLARCFSDCNQTVEGMRKLTTEIFDTLFVFLVYFAYLICFDVQMTLFTMIPILASVLFAFLMRKPVYNISKKNREINGEMTSQTYDLLNNAILYRVYGRDEDNLKKYDKTLRKYERSNVRNNLINDTLIPIVYFISLAGIFPVIILGSQRVVESDLLTFPIPVLMQPHWTIGQFTTYLLTFVAFAAKASHTAKLFSSIEKGLSSWSRIKPYIEPYKEYEKASAVRLSDEIHLRNYSLNLLNRDLIKDLNLDLKRGEILGVTGPIACGKSAFAKTFLQQIDYQGEIDLFGKEVRDYSRGEVKGTTCYMGHKNSLLTDTLENNIALGENIDVRRYLSMVCFDEDMEDMPQREKTLIGAEGVRLSSGQKDRVALARTLCHKMDLIILDDPFSTIDKETESQILKNIKAEIKDSAVLLISHRLDAFKDLDKVLVFHGDGTYALGDPETLEKEDLVYRNLIELQRQEGHHE